MSRCSLRLAVVLHMNWTISPLRSMDHLSFVGNELEPNLPDEVDKPVRKAAMIAFASTTIRRFDP